MRRWTSLLLLAALLLPHAALAAQEGGEPTPAVSGDTVLLPGDVIRVQIYREPELNGDFLVDEAGVATLPLIGDRKVAGIPIRQLREELTGAYREHLRNPAINIIPLRRINVLGEVNRPGLYPLDPTVSLAGAVATAGGASAIGDLSRIKIVRDGQVIRERVQAGETLSTANIRSGDIILVERRSWFERNSTFVVSALLSLTGIVSSIIIATSRR